MKRNSLRLMYAEFTEIFNFRQDDAKGRSITLASVVLSALYNVFITGLFYTGFLSMYGMSITDAGIVTFILYSVQFMCLMRAVTMLVMGAVLVSRWRVFTPQEDIYEVDSYRKARQRGMLRKA